MGTPAYNLVIVKGDKEVLDAFEKLAFKNESEAICFEQLLPLPDYLSQKEELSDEVQSFLYLIYGSRWVAAFGILIEKSDSFLKYYFNSKNTKAQLDYIAIKFSKLRYTHVFFDCVEQKYGVIEYENGNRVLDFTIQDENIDWQIVSDVHTYLYIAELYHKLMLCYHNYPEIFNELTHRKSDKRYAFYNIFAKSRYLTDNESFYDSLFKMEQNLEKRILDYARNGTAYPFSTNTPKEQQKFINHNFLPSEKRTLYLNNIINVRKKIINANREWWNNLDKIWKDEFITNLLNSPGYEGKKMLPTEIIKMIEKSDEIITDIVNLEKLNISRKLFFDLTPVFYLKKINDFHLQAVDWDDPNAEYFIKLYPKHLRSKVRKLFIDGIPLWDFTSLNDFVNVEEMHCQSCCIESLDGIEKLTKLKVLYADQGNSYSDLNPLRGLGLTYLNIEFTKVTDISPLIDVPSLEVLDLSFLKIDDFSPLLQLPNLKTVILDNLEFTMKELKGNLKNSKII